MDKFSELKKRIARQKTTAEIAKIKKISPVGFEKWGYDPNDEQLSVHESSASFKLLVGSPRSGKTATMILEILTHLLKYPEARGYLSRQHDIEFKKTIFAELNKWLKKIPIKEHRENKVTFLNGSELLYGGLFKAEKHLKGLEISIFGADQIEEMEEIVFKTLASRLSLNIPERKGLLTCNIAVPEWARQRFIENPETFHQYFKLYPQNNEFLPADYLDKQKKIWGDEYFEAMLACDLDYIQVENNIFGRDEIKGAFKREKVPGERAIGCDPAREGNDECVISEKVGNHLRIVESYRKKDTNFTVRRLKKIAGDKETPIYIDMGSFGSGIFDRLREENYKVIGIDFSTTPDDPRKYNLRKAEIIFKLKEDLINLAITSDSLLEEQMRNIRYKILSTEKIGIETKEERIRRGLKSYDRLMSLALANLSETTRKEEYGEDRRGAFELDNGRKIYLINYSINISQMVADGLIGRLEVECDPATISEYDLNTMISQGFLRPDWIERRRRFFKYIEKYRRTGKSLGWLNELEYRY